MFGASHLCQGHWLLLIAVCKDCKHFRAKVMGEMPLQSPILEYEIIQTIPFSAFNCIRFIKLTQTK